MAILFVSWLAVTTSAVRVEAETAGRPAAAGHVGEQAQPPRLVDREHRQAVVSPIGGVKEAARRMHQHFGGRILANKARRQGGEVLQFAAMRAGRRSIGEDREMVLSISFRE